MHIWSEERAWPGAVCAPGPGEPDRVAQEGVMTAHPNPLKLWDRDKGKAVEEFMLDHQTT